MVIHNVEVAGKCAKLQLMVIGCYYLGEGQTHGHLDIHTIVVHVQITHDHNVDTQYLINEEFQVPLLRPLRGFFYLGEGQTHGHLDTHTIVVHVQITHDHNVDTQYLINEEFQVPLLRPLRGFNFLSLNLLPVMNSYRNYPTSYCY